MNVGRRVWNILFNPAAEWEAIKLQPISINEMFTKYAALLALIPSIAGFIGYSFFGISMDIVTIRVPIARAMVWAILTYILTLGSLFLNGYIIDALAPSFGASKNLEESMKVSVFSGTAALVVSIFTMLPVLSFMSLLGTVYTFVLLYLGLKIVKNPPAQKLTGYFLVSLLIMVIIYFVAGMLAGLVITAGLIPPAVR